MRRQWLWLCLAMVPVLAADEVDYEAKIVSGKVGEEWSRKEVGTTPNGRKFLGPFGGHEVVKLRLGEYEDDAVRFFRVTFTLFVIHGADGNYAYHGPDPWVLRVADGPELWRTNFSNCGWLSVNNDQSYPEPFPGTHNQAWTGAAEKGTLGYVKTWGGTPHPVDSVYEMGAVFPHRGGEVSLEFFSESEETISGEAWGLENVRVEEIPRAEHDAADWERLWGDLLKTEEVRIINWVMWEFVAGGEEGMRFLKKKLGDDSLVDKAEVEGLLADLDSGEFVKREKASRRLLELGNAVGGALAKELTKDWITAEKRARVVGLLGKIRGAEDAPIDGERLREMRARWAMKVGDGG